MFQFSNVPMFKCSNVQIFKYSNVQMFKCPNFQTFKYSNVQICRSVPPEFPVFFMSCSNFFCDEFVLILILIKIRCAGGALTWTSYVVGTGPSRTSSRQKWRSSKWSWRTGRCWQLISWIHWNICFQAACPQLWGAGGILSFTPLKKNWFDMLWNMFGCPFLMSCSSYEQAILSTDLWTLLQRLGWIRPSQPERKDEWAEEKSEQEVCSGFHALLFENYYTLSSSMASNQPTISEIAKNIIIAFRIEEFGELELPSSSSSPSFSTPASNPQSQLYLTSTASASSLYSQVVILTLILLIQFLVVCPQINSILPYFPLAIITVLFVSAPPLLHLHFLTCQWREAVRWWWATFICELLEHAPFPHDQETHKIYACITHIVVKA